MSKQMQNQYDPDCVSPPGETLIDILDEKNLSIEWLSQSLDLKLIDTQRLLSGEMEITNDIALRLEQALVVPAGFWINREKFYRDSLMRKESSSNKL